MGAIRKLPAGRADIAAGSALTAIVAYEAAAYLTGRPKLTEVCRRHPLLAHALAQAWLLHVFAYTREVAAEVAREVAAETVRELEDEQGGR